MSNWEAYKQTMVTPSTLWSVAKENDLPTLERLMAQGYDVNARDHRGYSPLMLAAYSGNAEAVEFLLRQGADPSDVRANRAAGVVPLFAGEWRERLH